MIATGNGPRMVGGLSYVRRTRPQAARAAASRDLHGARDLLLRQTEAQLTQTAVPYEAGMSRYRELARGHQPGRPVRNAETAGIHLVDTVLNHPTLSEAYKVAAPDVSNI